MYQLAEARMAQKKFIKAREMLTKLRDDYPETSEAHLAQLRIADSLFETKAYALAAVEYQVFTEFHPASKWASYALFRLGLSKYNDVDAIDRDQQTTTEAVEAFRKLTTLYPDAQETSEAKPKLLELERRLVAHDLYIGEFYLKIKEYRAAAGRFETVLTKAVDQDQLTTARFNLASCYFKMRKYEQAQSSLTQVLTESLTPPQSRAATEMLATIVALPPTPTPTPTPTTQESSAGDHPKTY